VVAFNSSLYYLTEDEDGPQLRLTQADLALLKHAVVQRFRVIILRDLQPENRTKSIYRGLERSCANWFRLKGYCPKGDMGFAELQIEITEDLSAFLIAELHDVCIHGAVSCVNCTQVRLKEYADSLGVDLDNVASGWRQLF
ncbi:MAG: hypothetical protein PF442_13260, partial [Desulfobulbaceae bacterium]|nr:hypothetical protein [Desulfobulbaceae bacterium]